MALTRAIGQGGLLAWVPAVAWAALIFYLSSRPSVPLPPEVEQLPLLDKFQHFAEYGIFAMLILVGLRRGPRLPRPISPDFHPHLAFFIATVYAYTDEVHQAFVPARQADFFDFLADALGAFTAAFVLSMYITPAPPPPRPPDREIRLRYGRISFQTSGEGPAVLYLHGWHGSKRYFRSAAKHLAGFRHIAFDMVGFGNSSAPARFSYSPRDQAQVALAVARSLGVQQAVVVGHSMGGAVAVELALCDPSFVRGLVLIEPAIRLPVPYPFLLTLSDLREIGVGVPRHFIGLRISPLIHYFVEDPKLFQRPFIEDALSVPLHASVRSISQLYRADLFSKLGDLRCPVMLVFGDAVHVARAKYARLLNDALPYSTLIHFPRTSHCPMLETPAEFYQTLGNFLEHAAQAPPSQGRGRA